MTLQADVNSLTPGSLIDLYQLDMNPIGFGIVYYFYPGTNASYGAVTYLGNTYQPWPIEITGIEKRNSGSEARPRVKISNIGNTITTNTIAYADFVGAILKRIRTLYTYVQSNTADFVTDSYFIEQKVSETALVVEFDLTSALDFVGKRLPGRTAINNSCPWQYKSIANGSGCGWPGTDATKWFDANGNSVGSSTLDICGKRLSDCKLRFGANNPLDFGGFPSLGRNG